MKKRPDKVGLRRRLLREVGKPSVVRLTGSQWRTANALESQGLLRIVTVQGPTAHYPTTLAILKPPARELT
jgi:hypothetical protein